MKKKKKITSIANKSVEKDVYSAFGLAFVMIFIFFTIPFTIGLILLKQYAGFDISWIQVGLNGIILVLGLIMIILGRKKNDRER